MGMFGSRIKEKLIRKISLWPEVHLDSEEKIRDSKKAVTLKQDMNAKR